MNKMKDGETTSNSDPDNSEYRLNIWFPAGIGLFCIGCLTLVTPLIVSLEPTELWIDMVSGGILTLAGAFALVKGAKRFTMSNEQ